MVGGVGWRVGCRGAGEPGGGVTNQLCQCYKQRLATSCSFRDLFPTTPHPNKNISCYALSILPPPYPNKPERLDSANLGHASNAQKAGLGGMPYTPHSMNT